MRYLLLTRGLPFCGKTTWIKQHGLENFTLDSKTFNRLLQSPKLHISGKYHSYQSQHKLAFSLLMQALESRMVHGDFIVIEDLHISKSYFSNYQEMANQHGYKILLVDFSHVLIDDILERNKRASIESKYSTDELYRLQEMLADSIPINCDIIKPYEVHNILSPKAKNLSRYRQIYHIGDIHGCFDVLDKFLKNMQDDCFYIFLGDYIDRGNKNYEVLNALLNIAGNKNVCLLEGNHEKWLWQWANNKDVHAKEFRLNTQIELENKGFSKHNAKRFYKSLKPYLHYTFHDKEVICTHGGLSNLPINLNLLSAAECVYGSGGYMEAKDVISSFNINTKEGIYQVFGHRNTANMPMQNMRSFILEGKVEMGGFLRIAMLDSNGFSDKSFCNKSAISNKKDDNLRKYINAVIKENLAKELSKNLILCPTNSLNSTYNIPQIKNLIIDKTSYEIAARSDDISSTISFSESFKKIFSKDGKIDSKVYALRFGEPYILSYFNDRFILFRLDTNEIVDNAVLLDSNRISLLKELFNGGSFSINLLGHFGLLHGTQGVESKMDSINQNNPSLQGYIANEAIYSANTITNLQINNTNKQDCHAIARNDCDTQSNTPKIEHKSKWSISNIFANSINIESNSHLIDSIAQILEIDKPLLLGNYNKAELQKLCLSASDESTEYKANLYAIENGIKYEIDSYYTKEYRAMSHIFRIWILKDSVEKLSFVNTSFRERFFTFIKSEFEKDRDILKLPFTHVWNLFLMQ